MSSDATIWAGMGKRSRDGDKTTTAGMEGAAGRGKTGETAEEIDSSGRPQRRR